MPCQLSDNQQCYGARFLRVGVCFVSILSMWMSEIRYTDLPIVSRYSINQPTINANAEEVKHIVSKYGCQQFQIRKKKKNLQKSNEKYSVLHVSCYTMYFAEIHNDLKKYINKIRSTFHCSCHWPELTKASLYSSLFLCNVFNLVNRKTFNI